MGRKGKTLEAQEPLFRRGVPTLQTSLTSRELPPTAPALAWQKFVSLCMVRVLLGEVFVVWRGADRKKSAAIALFGVDFFGKGLTKSEDCGMIDTREHRMTVTSSD